MKTTEFRCATCDKLLAKFTGGWNFDEVDIGDPKYIIDGAEQYLEIKCPRCKHINKKEMVGDSCVFGKEVHGDVAVHMPKRQVGKGLIDTEALEAHNRVSRHGDNV